MKISPMCCSEVETLIPCQCPANLLLTISCLVLFKKRKSAKQITLLFIFFLRKTAVSQRIPTSNYISRSKGFLLSFILGTFHNKVLTHSEKIHDLSLFMINLLTLCLLHVMCTALFNSVHPQITVLNRSLQPQLKPQHQGFVIYYNHIVIVIAVVSVTFVYNFDIINHNRNHNSKPCHKSSSEFREAN